jgi:OPT family oligopeptide transporter
MLSGLRACSSLLMGSILGWGILGPIVHYNKWVNGKVLEYNGVRGWILWVGVAIMTADSFVQLLFSIKFIISGIWSLFIRIKSTIKRENRFVADTPGQIPASWWLIGLLISTISLTLVGHFIFDLKWYFVLLAIPLSFLLSVIAVRCTGETDINPVGGMGKVTQLAYAVVAPHQVTTNLLAAGIVGAGASQAGDMMQDLKTGYLVRVTPRNQFIAQCIGIVAGVVFCVPIFKLFDSAYAIGGEQIPAPAAHAWKAVAVILAKGLEELPLYSGWGILGGIIFGIVVGLINRIAGIINKNWPSYLPSALAFGIGMVVPPKQSLTMFFGAMFSLIWKWGNPTSHLNYFFAVSSGLIAGEGLMGIFTALLKLAGVQPLVK